jgi:putative transferase (TIGR04331 family)
MADFHRLFVADEWNHHIYARVLQHFPEVSCGKVQRAAAAGVSRSEPASSVSRRARQVLATLAGRAAGLLARDHDAFFLGSYLPLGDDVRLQLGMGQMPQRWRPVPPVRAAVDPQQRNWALDGSNESRFEACVRALIPAQIPAIYLEGYSRLIEQTGRVGWPRRPRLIFTSNGQWADDLFKAWAAEKVAVGAPLVIGQHGGHLGAGKWSFVEDHDVAISDRYLSWGWTDPQHPNIRATCQLKARRPLGVHHAHQPRALLVTCAFPRFSYWMYSAIVARQWLDYFEDQCAFVAHLPAPIRSALTVRLYPEDFGWDQASRWRERMPDVRLDQGGSQMDDLIRESRLYISTYNATTYLESLTMDVPTVIYWNPRHWELRDSASGFFEDLRRIGVFHETAESAARHVAAVWDDIDAWWSSPAVREVLHRFMYRYCRVVDDVAAVVDVALREVETVPRLGMAQ